MSHVRADVERTVHKRPELKTPCHVIYKTVVDQIDTSEEDLIEATYECVSVVNRIEYCAKMFYSINISRQHYIGLYTFNTVELVGRPLKLL